MMILDEDASVPLWRPQPADEDAALGFSTRRGGVSPPPYDSLNLGMSTADTADAVARNRGRLLDALALDPTQLATAGQVHGARVVEVDAPGHAPDCDALITRTRGLALAVTAADCAPVLFQAPGWVAAAHSGWRGTADGLPRHVASTLCRRAEVAPGALRVVIGPCIAGCCYEVGPDVAHRFPAAALTRRHSRHFLDLSTAIRIQLLDAGIPESGLIASPACTACAPDWYFSHRRDAGLTGRHWGVIALRSGPERDPGVRGSAGV
jgi:YfiH family protein